MRKVITPFFFNCVFSVSPFNVKCIVVQINIMEEVPGDEMVCSYRLSSVFNPLKAYLNSTLPAQVPAFAFLSYNIWILLDVY